MTQNRRNFLGSIACAFATVGRGCRIPVDVIIEPARAVNDYDLVKYDINRDAFMTKMLRLSMREMENRVLMNVFNGGPA